MIHVLLIGFTYTLPLGLGYFIGFIQGYKSSDEYKFEKRWDDCE